MNDVTTETQVAKKFDPEAFAMNLARAMESSGQALAAYLKPRENGELKDKPPSELGEVIKTFTAVAEYWLSDKTRSAELQMKMGKAYLDLWGSSMRRLAGEQAPPAIEPSPRDKRFSDPEWKSNQFFDFVMQLYLLTTQWAHDLVINAEGLDPHTRKKAEFYVQQITNALAPSNFVLTNPGSPARDAGVERRQPRSRHENAGGGHRGRTRHACASVSPIPPTSRSASTWRRRRAR